MKVLLASGIIALASAGSGAAAAPSASDFEVVSVVPRNPDVKPILMSISTSDLRKADASPQTGAQPPNTRRHDGDVK